MSGTFNSAMPTPLTRPTVRPMSSVNPIASGMFAFEPAMTRAVTRLVSVITAPTDRSMPATRMARFWPMATTPSSPISCSRLATWVVLR